MAQKDKIKEIVNLWRNTKNEKEEKALLSQIKKEFDHKSSDELMKSLRALKEEVIDFKAEVFASSSSDAEEIVIRPSSKEDASFIKLLLKKMNIPFEGS